MYSYSILILPANCEFVTMLLKKMRKLTEFRHYGTMKQNARTYFRPGVLRMDWNSSGTVS
jgi:hypothetical protein